MLGKETQQAEPHKLEQSTFGQSTDMDCPPAPRNVTVALPSTLTFLTVFTLSLQKASAAHTCREPLPRQTVSQRRCTAADGRNDVLHTLGSSAAISFFDRITQPQAVAPVL